MVGRRATQTPRITLRKYISDNPVVYWRFEETTGTTAANLGSLGAPQQGTFLGGVTLGQTGAITGNSSNYAVRLSPATDGRIQMNNAITTAANVFNDGSYTIELWFNQPTFGVSQDLLAGTNPANSDNHGILLETVGTASTPQLRFLHRSPSGSGGGQQINPSSQSYEIDAWNHLVAVVENGNMELYLNGAPHSGVGPLVSADINFDLNFVLGRIQPNNALREFDGFIDEFAIYDQAFSQADVLRHFNAAGTPVPEPASLMLWSLFGLGLACFVGRRRWK